MEFVRERELVHLRYELRRLLAERRGEEAKPLLERLRRIAEDEAREAVTLQPEILRWATTFGL
ncbi:MAG TPA: hypothetical protein VGP07_22290 [Polyangia bacterium]|jgi:hypothetical protein